MARVTEDTIQLSTREICRYEILCEGVEYQDSVRFPVKRGKNAESEFNVAVDMCKSDNIKYGMGRIYKSVKLIDRAKCKVIMSETF